jgi:hypothetical protein
MLNEAAVGEMEKLRICLPEKKQRRHRITISKTNNKEKEASNGK